MHFWSGEKYVVLVRRKICGFGPTKNMHFWSGGERRYAQVPVWVVHSPQLDVRGAGHQQLQVRPVRVQASGVKPSIRFASFESVESLQWTRALEVP